MSNEERILNVLRGWIGYSERNGKYREIIDIYNADKPLPRGYLVKYTDEWCATTVSAAAIVAGVKETIGKECSCEQFIRIFKNKQIWNEEGESIPKKGDIILYNWGDKVQPNDGRADHIGIVEEVKDGVITVIEGNRNAMVARRRIYVGNGYIRGFARPNYGGTNPDTDQSEKSVVLNVDGWWGKDTTRASQKLLGTVEDGIVSRQPVSNRKYLYRASVSSWRFTSRYYGGSSMVKALQSMIGAEPDGYFGKKTVKAFQVFLKKCGYYSGQLDYSMGGGTVRAWQEYVNDHIK